MHCLDVDTGDELWRREVRKVRSEVVADPSGPATITPVADEASVYTFFPDVGLLSYDRNGNKRWRVNLAPFHTAYGLGSSLVHAGGKIFLLADQIGRSYLAAFDADNGDLAWRVERADGLTAAYSTPIIHPAKNGSAELVVAGPFDLAAYDTSTGRRLWWATGVTNSPVGGPVIAGNRVIVNEPVAQAVPFQVVEGNDENKDGSITAAEVGGVGFSRLLERIDRDWGDGDGGVAKTEWDEAFGSTLNRGGLVAVDLGGSGDVTKTHVAWRRAKSGSRVPTVLAYRGAIFLIRDGGILTTVDPETGDEIRQGRLHNAIGKYWASPVGGDAKAYFASGDGKVAVVRADANWEVLAVNDLGEDIHATPAIARDRLYIRTRSTLYCFGS